MRGIARVVNEKWSRPPGPNGMLGSRVKTKQGWGHTFFYHVIFHSGSNIRNLTKLCMHLNIGYAVILALHNFHLKV